MPRRHPRAFARLESMRVLNRASALALLAALALLTAAVVPAEPPDVPAPAPASPPALPPPETRAPPAEPVAPEPPSAPAAAPPPRVLWFHRHPRRAQAAWVAAANPLAVDAGLEILARGGKAVDAAVAVQAMLGLVEPQSSGIGGGAFLLYYDAGSRKLSALEGRERAPAGAQPDMFLDEHGKPLPFVEAVRSGRSTGVPGAIAMLYAAHSKLGRLRWKDLFQPAIRAATAGFKVPARLASFLGEGSPFPPTNEVRMMFSRPDGDTVQEGDLFRNPKYAHTLERIARQGPRALYEGEIAREIVATTHLPPLPGTMTLKDLASYRASWTEPVCRPYRGYSVCVPPPPSSGVSLLQMLSILDRTDIGGRRPRAAAGSPTRCAAASGRAPRWLRSSFSIAPATSWPRSARPGGPRFSNTTPRRWSGYSPGGCRSRRRSSCRT